MKRPLILSALAFACLAFLLVPGIPYAATTCGSSDGKPASAVICSVDTDKAPGKKGCSPREKTACAHKTGEVEEKCHELCVSGLSRRVTMSVRGMADEDSETSVTASLEVIPGILKVHDISHKSGTASLCIDTARINDRVLVAIMAKNGYKAEVTSPETTPTAGVEVKKGCCSAKKGSRVCTAKKTSSEPADDSK